MAGLVNPIKSTSLYEISVDTANPCNYGDCRPFLVFFKTVYTKAKAKNKRKMARVSNLPSRRDYWQGLPVCTIACTLIPFTVLKLSYASYPVLVSNHSIAILYVVKLAIAFSFLLIIAFTVFLFYVSE